MEMLSLKMDISEKNLWNRNFSQCSQFSLAKGRHVGKAADEVAKLLAEKYMQRGTIELPFIEVILTTVCTLKCTECSNLIPKFGRLAKHVSPDDFKKEIKCLLNEVEYIHRLKIHGGEPLTHPNLAEIINFCCNEEKVGEVRLSTNCTILPDASLIKAMQNKKFLLFLSNYKISECHPDKYLEICESYGIRYRFDPDQEWVPYGEVKLYSKSYEQLADNRENCSMANCLSMRDFKVYLCSRIANATALGLIREDKGISVMERDFKDKLIQLYKENINAGCEYCGVNVIKHIKAGKQEC